MDAVAFSKQLKNVIYHFNLPLVTSQNNKNMANDTQCHQEVGA